MARYRGKRYMRRKVLIPRILILGAILIICLTIAALAAGRGDAGVAEAPASSVCVEPERPTIYAEEIELVVEEPAEPDGPTPTQLENAQRIVDFVTTKWADAYVWLQENYNENWPHGPVKENRDPVDLSETIGIAIAANAMRESSCHPNISQSAGKIADDAESVTQWLLGLGSKSGRAWGIIQWDGGRRYNFAQFCDASGFDPCSLDIQLYYLAYEYYATYEYGSYRVLISEYNESAPSLETVTEAAEVFREDVERGGTAHANEVILKTWGNKWDYSWGEKPEGGLYDYLS